MTLRPPRSTLFPTRRSSDLKRLATFDAKGSILVGDVHPEVEEVAGALTPVPGGVGPLTITMLMHNTLKAARSEEHTSELQSQSNLVCRLLLEKKKTTTRQHQ